MSNFHNIARSLGLPADSDAGDVREAAKTRRKELHPDKTEGEFKSEKQKEEYHKLTEFIADTGSTDLAVRREASLAKEIRNLVEATTEPKSRTSGEIKKDCKETFESDLSSSYISPRIGSSVFFAITGFFATFAEQFDGDPVIGELFTYPGSRLLMLLLAFHAGIFFVLTWYDERAERAKIDSLLSTVGVKNTFTQIIRDTKRSGFSFPRDMYTELVRAELSASPRSVKTDPASLFRKLTRVFVSPFRGSMPQSTVDEIVDAHLSELQEKGAIHRTTEGLLVPEYKVSDQMIELWEDGSQRR